MCEVLRQGLALRLILFTRFPTPGEAKTRLIPRLAAEGAADVHRQLTEKTLGTLSAAATKNTAIEVHYTGASQVQFVDWLGSKVQLVAQHDGTLSCRLKKALNPTPAIFLGADTPDLSVSVVQQAIAALANHEVVLGPANDGGYYLIGLRDSWPTLFEDINWSTETVLAETRQRIDALGLSHHELITLSDCDRPEDLAAWPWLIA